MSATNGCRRFGPFELTTAPLCLRRDGRAVKIQPQPLRVLALLVEHAGGVVSRDDLRRRIWDEATFVEFDQGLNYCIRQIRLALADDSTKPAYIETVKKQGYRFIAPVDGLGVQGDGWDASRPPEHAAQDPVPVPAVEAPQVPAPTRRWALPWTALAALVAAGIVTAWLRPAVPLSSAGTVAGIQQITDFADSAVSPALSPDGRMLAFIRGGSGFLTPDRVYVKLLPDGDAHLLSDDPRLKYGPAFSPDGTRVAYTVMENSGWATYAVSALGGEPQLMLSNAAGLTWLDPHHLLFAEIREGQHMGIVTAAEDRSGVRDVYMPAHQRGMAHVAVPSPDRRRALVVEMDGQGVWTPCRLVSLDSASAGYPVGPAGACTAAAWSPDGRWMYFTAGTGADHHLWRQRVPDGAPEQLTFGPASNETGVAVDRDGSIVTSIGTLERTLWLHDASGDRAMSSEGDADSAVFSADGRFVYSLVSLSSRGGASGLRRLTVATGQSESLLPGVSMIDFDVSGDGRDVVYTALDPDRRSRIWIAPIDGRSPPSAIGRPGDGSPHFRTVDEIVFRDSDGRANYLERMRRDGSGRARVVNYPISEIQSVSPAGRWVTAVAPLADRTTVAIMAIPADGVGEPVRLCEIYCHSAWSRDGSRLFLSVEESSLTSTGRSLAIPVGPGESLPAFPVSGVRPFAAPEVIPGSRSVARADISPGLGPDQFAYVLQSVHRNLFRVRVR
jgi:DNA-binding winged helix-turn-helix (wHTH) protein/Tol biopolymer transport system component